MSDTKENVKLQIKPPKRVLHFSDGVIEECDSDEEESRSKEDSDVINKQIVMHNWPTLSSAINNAVWFGSKTLQICDYVGEGFANFLGITSPKYEYEIEEYNRRVEEEKNRERKVSHEFAGWTQSDDQTMTINSTDIKRGLNDRLSKEIDKY